MGLRLFGMSVECTGSEIRASGSAFEDRDMDFGDHGKRRQNGRGRGRDTAAGAGRYGTCAVALVDGRFNLLLVSLDRAGMKKQMGEKGGGACVSLDLFAIASMSAMTIDLNGRCSVGWNHIGEDTEPGSEPAGVWKMDWPGVRTQEHRRLHHRNFVNLRTRMGSSSAAPPHPAAAAIAGQHGRSGENTGIAREDVLGTAVEEHQAKRMRGAGILWRMYRFACSTEKGRPEDAHRSSTLQPVCRPSK
ncbi:hypothetical protein IWX90DRAFT_148016 [Phyllosticta citrichinensis]|uniref:Uncharacterized protein n=1 Tax=Phyllosticta citrichinensis TaxID=1130410 RepID=A0ABR1XZD5_9PEZI